MNKYVNVVNLINMTGLQTTTNFPYKDYPGGWCIKDISMSDYSIVIKCDNGTITGYGMTQCCDFWINAAVTDNVYTVLEDHLYISTTSTRSSPAKLMGETLSKFGIIRHKNKERIYFIITTTSRHFITLFKYNSAGFYSGSFSVSVDITNVNSPESYSDVDFSFDSDSE